MLIVDRDAEVKLAKVLERMRGESQSSRCFVLKLDANITHSADFKQALISASVLHLNHADVKIYLCGDGEIFVLAPFIPSKECHAYALALGAYLNRPVDTSWIEIAELPVSQPRLMHMVDAKVALVEAQERALKQQKEEAEAARKREMILTTTPTVTGETLLQRRQKRQHGEVLLIEDDAFSRKLVEGVFHKLYNLTSLAEATYALDTYARLSPDVVFLDIDLPDVTGHELLTRIMAIDPEAYVIMLSGNADRDNIMQALSLGAKGFVAKPFSKEKLLQALERCPTLTQAKS